MQLCSSEAKSRGARSSPGVHSHIPALIRAHTLWIYTKSRGSNVATFQLMIYIPQQICSPLKLQTVPRNRVRVRSVGVRLFRHVSAVCACALVSVSPCRALGVITDGRAAQEAPASSSITAPHPAHRKDVSWTWLTGDSPKFPLVCVFVCACMSTASLVSHQSRMSIHSTLCYFKSCLPHFLQQRALSLPSLFLFLSSLLSTLFHYTSHHASQPLSLSLFLWLLFSPEPLVVKSVD